MWHPNRYFWRVKKLSFWKCDVCVSLVSTLPEVDVESQRVPTAYCSIGNTVSSPQTLSQDDESHGESHAPPATCGVQLPKWNESPHESECSHT
jgi:hypothetical protein